MNELYLEYKDTIFLIKPNLSWGGDEKWRVFLGKKMAELPKDKFEASSAFLFLEILCKKNKFVWQWAD